MGCIQIICADFLSGISRHYNNNNNNNKNHVSKINGANNRAWIFVRDDDGQVFNEELLLTVGTLPTY